MKKNYGYQLKTNPAAFLCYIWSFILCTILNSNITFAQINSPGDTLNSLPFKENKTKNEKKFKMTTLTFGGNGLLWTKVNNKPAIMTGGRGSATFNYRYTIGGGGWACPKELKLKAVNPESMILLKSDMVVLNLVISFSPAKN